MRDPLASITRCVWPLIIAALIYGCMVGPDYSRPPVPQQNGWQAAKGAAALAAGGCSLVAGPQRPAARKIH